MLDLPIPTFDPSEPIHAELVAAAFRAESIAAAVPLPSDVGFVRARGSVRAALVAAGLAQDIDRLVQRLLGDTPAIAVGPPLGGVLDVVEFDDDSEMNAVIEQDDPNGIPN
jgi:hypothetical protein